MVTMAVARSGLKLKGKRPTLPFLTSKGRVYIINHYQMMSTNGDGSPSLDTPMDTNKMVKGLLAAGLPLETAATMTRLSSLALAKTLDTVAADAVTRSTFEQVYSR